MTTVVPVVSRSTTGCIPTRTHLLSKRRHARVASRRFDRELVGYTAALRILMDLGCAATSMVSGRRALSANEIAVEENSTTIRDERGRVMGTVIPILQKRA